VSRKIRFDQLDTLVSKNSLTVFKATLTVIPEFGCRLFVTFKEERFNVVTEEGEPKYFTSIAEGVQQLADIPGLDHQIVVDIISLVGSTARRKARSALSGVARSLSLIPA
jgi:hypothetical protein